jgi:hypothetical protein
VIWPRFETSRVSGMMILRITEIQLFGFYP